MIRTRSMKSTTKSCSTYLSQNRPQFLHTVSRMLCPLDGSPAPEYCVHSVLTGCRHSMQIGMVFSCSASSSGRTDLMCLFPFSSWIPDHRKRSSSHYLGRILLSCCEGKRRLWREMFTVATSSRLVVYLGRARYIAVSEQGSQWREPCSCALNRVKHLHFSGLPDLIQAY